MEIFTKKQLVAFGNYLLSDERRSHFKSVKMRGIPLKTRLSQVHDADIANFIESTKK